MQTMFPVYGVEDAPRSAGTTFGTLLYYWNNFDQLLLNCFYSKRPLLSLYKKFNNVLYFPAPPDPWRPLPESSPSP
jgi:hypothetical protein